MFELQCCNQSIIRLAGPGRRGSPGTRGNVMKIPRRIRLYCNYRSSLVCTVQYVQQQDGASVSSEWERQINPTVRHHEGSSRRTQLFLFPRVFSHAAKVRSAHSHFPSPLSAQQPENSVRPVVTSNASCDFFPVIRS